MRKVRGKKKAEVKSKMAEGRLLVMLKRSKNQKPRNKSQKSG
jgi:hypothetical protein